MQKKTLVIMAAGIGSRFGGGIKQLEPMGPNGEIIMDYSIYDALRAGFDKVVFVIRKDLEKDFREVIGKKIEKVTDVGYAFQEVGNIPQAFKQKFSERTKPWGTGQAILSCKGVVDSPFLVINADDYYGKSSFEMASKKLSSVDGNADKMNLGMIGFVLGNTLSENGAVTRGICQVDANGMLENIAETAGIEKAGDGAVIKNESSEKAVDSNSPVSMNMWCLPTEIFKVLESGFENFVQNTDASDLKAEYLFPEIVGEMLKNKKAAVEVLTSKERWFGVTYKEDKPFVVGEIKKLIESGVYPSKLY